MGIESLSLEKVNSVIGMLASDQDGEVLAAARLLCRMAKKSNLKINEFLRPPTIAPAPDAKFDPRTYQATQRPAATTTDDVFKSFADFILREGQRQSRSQTTQRQTHAQATLEIIKRIRQKTAGTTALTSADQGLLRDIEWRVENGQQISAAMAQMLANLARRVGA